MNFKNFLLLFFLISFLSFFGCQLFYQKEKTENKNLLTALKNLKENNKKLEIKIFEIENQPERDLAAEFVVEKIDYKNLKKIKLAQTTAKK